MSDTKIHTVTIVGAGLVGSLLSIYLVRRGYKVTMYERRPDMRKFSISAGKSINLALSDRGWKGLEGVGIAEDIRNVAIPMYGRMMHGTNGALTFQPYGEKNQAIYAASRGLLNCEMMNLAEKNGVKIFFNHRCTHIDLDHARAKFELHETGKETIVESDLVFGADGAFSAARLQMQVATDRFEYSQHYIDHSYKELLIPAGPSGTFLMEKNALHIWPRGGYMLIALPNLDGSFTCTLFLPVSGKESFHAIQNDQDCRDFFTRVFPDTFHLMPDLLHDFFANPTGSLVTIKCFPWCYKQKLALIGDAAHAIIPFYGQGMNCGFEDCTVLDGIMDEMKDDWSKILPAYQAARKENADAIAQLAYENFIEMRDKVGDPSFLLRKKIEAHIHRKHPTKWLPLYSQVTFSNIPYSLALKNGYNQDRIMDRIMEVRGIESKWDSKEVEDMILSQI